MLRRNSQVTESEERDVNRPQQRPTGIDRSGIHIKNIDEFEYNGSTG